MLGRPPFINAQRAIFFHIRVKYLIFTSKPALNIKKITPIELKKSIVGEKIIKFKPKGPITIPAIIKESTYGR